MSEQDGRQATALQRPANDDKEAWKAYWKAQGQPWRTEPVIDAERQAFLTERRSITPDIKQGIYPFKGTKLSRADVEWLLATHENGRGPIDWSDESQRKREGLDLRGADLSQEDLRGLPLACMEGGLLPIGTWKSTEEQRNMAAVQLQKADLSAAQLQGASLIGAQLQKADLWDAQLQGASLIEAQLQKADLPGAQLQGADLLRAQMQGANLAYAQLERTYLGEAHLEEARLDGAHLEGAYLEYAHLEGADLLKAYLAGAWCCRTFFDGATRLNGVSLSDEKNGSASLAEVSWGNVNLSVVRWSQLTMLGDEYEARQKKKRDGKKKGRDVRLDEYEQAVRANRQLAVVLRDQGMNEEADRFAYRAQKLQRVVLRRQRKFGRYLFFGFLDLLAGYGYRPGRSVFWYLAIVCGFALGYHLLGQLSLFPPDAFVYSLTSFHGRGFFPGLEHRTSLHDPLIMLAALEAVVGLFIEISFIATFTQRFFGR